MLFIVYSGIAIPAAEVIFGEGTGPIHYDELACSGLEQSINKCSHSNYNDCTHSEDAGVICDGSKIVDSDLCTMNEIISICTLELSPQSKKRQHKYYHTVKNSSKNPAVTSYKQKLQKGSPQHKYMTLTLLAWYMYRHKTWRIVLAGFSGK
jgi:hypothetical protein